MNSGQFHVSVVKVVLFVVVKLSVPCVPVYCAKAVRLINEHLVGLNTSVFSFVPEKACKLTWVMVSGTVRLATLVLAVMKAGTRRAVLPKVIDVTVVGNIGPVHTQ